MVSVGRRAWRDFLEVTAASWLVFLPANQSLVEEVVLRQDATVVVHHHLPPLPHLLVGAEVASPVQLLLLSGSDLGVVLVAIHLPVEVAGVALPEPLQVAAVRAMSDFSVAMTWPRSD